MGVVVDLPDELRGALSDPFGPIFTDPEALLVEVSGPLIAVGDVVTYHLQQAGRPPDVAVIDARTKRSPVADDVQSALGDPDVTVPNPAATLTEELILAIRDAIDDESPRCIMVDGEEDLATLPAIIAAPIGASVVYGQPNEGMVHVRVTPERQATIRSIIEQMHGDPTTALALLE